MTYLLTDLYGIRKHIKLRGGGGERVQSVKCLPCALDNCTPTGHKSESFKKDISIDNRPPCMQNYRGLS